MGDALSDPAMLAATGQIGGGQQQPPSQGIMNLPVQVLTCLGVNFGSSSPGLLGVLVDTPGPTAGKIPSLFSSQINMPASALGRQLAACFVSKDELFAKQTQMVEGLPVADVPIGEPVSSGLPRGFAAASGPDIEIG